VSFKGRLYAKTMDILLGRGLGDQIRFGMSMSQIEQLLGKPDKIIPLDEEDERVEHHYNQLKTVFRYYDKDGVKLGWIETENPQIELFGVKAMGLEKSGAINLLSTQGHDSLEFDDYGSFETLFFEECWLELQLTFDRVSRVKFGVFIDENDEYCWPI